ncbi:MAG: HAD family hydrolase [Desulfuromonadaceae bacterium]|nr:HAD family hydrolase [Desulfuromonadaceae bacterium]MDD5104141.1 HAD family hydrolase [Desulfuromonadaceae bacterium]
MSADIRGIVFDLDGTLYVNDRFADEIKEAAVAYIAELKLLDHSDASELMAATRLRLEEENGTKSTLSAVCAELGGTVQGLHRFFEAILRPEVFLIRDEKVVQLLERLAKRFALYIYTNNNRVLATRIINYLGFDSVMSGIFTIDDTWQGKPDERMVQKVLEQVRLRPESVLFVGDRYDVDLRIPEQLGCPVYLIQSLEQLFRLESLLIPIPDHSPLFVGSSSAPQRT